MKKHRTINVYFENDNVNIRIGSNLKNADIIIKGNGTITAVLPGSETIYYIFAK